VVLILSSHWAAAWNPVAWESGYGYTRVPSKDESEIVCEVLEALPARARGAVHAIDFIHGTSSPDTEGAVAGNVVGLLPLVHPAINTPEYTRTVAHEVAHVVFNGLDSTFAGPEGNLWVPPASPTSDYATALDWIQQRRAETQGDHMTFRPANLELLVEAVGATSQSLATTPSTDLHLYTLSHPGGRWSHGPGWDALVGDPWNYGFYSSVITPAGWYGAKNGQEDIATWLGGLTADILNGAPTRCWTDYSVFTGSLADLPPSRVPHLAKLMMLDFLGVLPDAAYSQCLSSVWVDWGTGLTIDNNPRWKRMSAETTSIWDGTYFDVALEPGENQAYGAQSTPHPYLGPQYYRLNFVHADSGNPAVGMFDFYWSSLAGGSVLPSGLYRLDEIVLSPSGEIYPLHQLIYGGPDASYGAVDTPDCYQTAAGRHVGESVGGLALVLLTDGWWKGVILGAEMECEYLDLTDPPNTAIGTWEAPPIVFYTDAPKDQGIW